MQVLRGAKHFLASGGLSAGPFPNPKEAAREAIHDPDLAPNALKSIDAVPNRAGVPANP
jgi:hypothetical protein